jgi:membrane protein DedA with SNARE-associated domain
VNVFLTASITEPLVNICIDVIDWIGYTGIFILMLLESACMPVPSEGTMLFAGFQVHEGDMTLFGVTAAGVLGNLVGSWVAYAAGYYGRLELLEKSKFIHINPKHLKVADDWFEKYGSATVFFTRMLPIIRTFISLPAGIARMPFWRFTWLTLLGCIPWVLMLAYIGQQVGEEWENWQDKLHYIDYTVAVFIVGAAIYFGIRWYRNRGGGGDDGSESVQPAEASG